MSARGLLLRALGVGGAQAMSILGYRSQLTILIFHSVSEQWDPLGHSDTHAVMFERQVHALTQAFNVMSFGQAVRHLSADSLPARSACITFDDGYADNYTLALPILQKHAATATFFIASDYLNGGQMFNDIVIESVRRCSRTSLDLEHLGLGVHALNDVEQRAKAIGWLLGQVKPMPLEKRQQSVLAIAEAAGISAQCDLMMTSEQVAGLAAAGMEIGAHTHRHPILSSLSDDEVREELLTSRRELQAISQQPVDVFAYPNGRPGQDYHLRHVQLVREAGFLAAVSTAHGAASFGADMYQLPRYTPWSRGAEEFIAKLMLNWRTQYKVAQ